MRLWENVCAIFALPSFFLMGISPSKHYSFSIIMQRRPVDYYNEKLPNQPIHVWEPRYFYQADFPDIFRRNGELNVTIPSFEEMYERTYNDLLCHGTDLYDCCSQGRRHYKISNDSDTCIACNNYYEQVYGQINHQIHNRPNNVADRHHTFERRTFTIRQNIPLDTLIRQNQLEIPRRRTNKSQSYRNLPIENKIHEIYSVVVPPLCSVCNKDASVLNRAYTISVNTNCMRCQACQIRAISPRAVSSGHLGPREFSATTDYTEAISDCCVRADEGNFIALQNIQSYLFFKF
jgi:hypothetical protein